MEKMRVIDDGTMDTVFECSECGKVERYSSDGIERDELTGEVLPNELIRVGEEHVCLSRICGGCNPNIEEPEIDHCPDCKG